MTHHLLSSSATQHAYPEHVLLAVRMVSPDSAKRIPRMRAQTQCPRLSALA